MATGPRFMTLPDVAEVLNVSVRQVRSLLHSGELRGIQVGGRGQWRVERDELENYIARQYQRTDELLADLEGQIGADSVPGADDRDRG